MKLLLFLTLAIVASFVSSGTIENPKDSLECPMENVNFSGEDLILMLELNPGMNVESFATMQSYASTGPGLMKNAT